MPYDKCQNAPPSSSDQISESLEPLQNFLNQCNKTGYLMFYVYQESLVYGRLPIPNARISLCQDLGNSLYICTLLMTDIDGKTESIPVPTVSAEFSQSGENVMTNTVYNASIEAPGFTKAEVYNIPVFEDKTTIQNVTLSPVVPPESPVKSQQE